MGLFDKKKKGNDEFDSPVEQINLSTPTARATPSPTNPPGQAPVSGEVKSGAAATAAPTATVKGGTGPATTAAPTAATGTASPATAAKPAVQAAAPAPAPKKVEEEQMDYGINRAIELMRLLPKDNVELVVQVVKKTLESTNVRITEIIDDGGRKQKRIEARIEVLRGEIAELESEIATRKNEISTLEADHEETTSVKERLILAEKISGGGQVSGGGSGGGQDKKPEDKSRTEQKAQAGA